MSIYDSSIWISDLDEVMHTLPELYSLAGKTVLVTGSTGLICSAVVDVLIRWNETHENKISILVAGRSREKVEIRFSPHIRENWFLFVPFDATLTNNTLAFHCDYIIHGASNASPNKILKEPVETMMSNIVGTKVLLDYARNNNVKRVVFISSSEVYGKKEHDGPNRVNEYGGIDILNTRSSYSIGKCAAETLCASYSEEHGVDTVIIRPGHIYGPTALETDNRVSSAWAYDVAHRKDIVMKSDGLQIRSYCYCLDSASAIILTMLNGKCSHAYNISNPESIINIKEMAEILTKTGGVELKIEIPTSIEKKGFNPMLNSSLDCTELLAIGWQALFNAERGFKHTVLILREMMVR